MTQIPDFSDAELAIIHAALEKRYGKPVETELADTELRLDPPVAGVDPVPDGVLERAQTPISSSARSVPVTTVVSFFTRPANNSAPAARSTTTSSNASRCCYRCRPIMSARPPSAPAAPPANFKN
jgi:hypothetical protein